MLKLLFRAGFGPSQLSHLLDLLSAGYIKRGRLVRDERPAADMRKPYCRQSAYASHETSEDVR